MPPTSKKQEKFMRAVANSPEFAKKVKVPQSVGREFMKEKKAPRGISGKGWKEAGFPSEAMYIRAQEAEMDRNMQEGARRQQETRVGGGKDMKEKKMARGGMAMMGSEKMPMMARGGKVKPKAKKMARGGMTKMASGGKVRGAGCAKKGTRPAKMV